MATAWQKSSHAAEPRSVSTSASFKALSLPSNFQFRGNTIPAISKLKKYTLSAIIQCEGGADEVVDWIKTNATRHIPFQRKQLLSVRAGEKIKTYEGFLYTGECTINQFPDVAILEKFEGRDLPLVLVEIHSGTTCEDHAASLTKTILCMVDQFRLLSDFTDQSLTLTGFTFPNDTQESCVTMVKLSWDSFRFNAELTDLEVGKVLHEVRAALSLTSYHQPTSVYYMKLSSAALEMFGRNARQVPTKSSITVFDPDRGTIIKFVPDERERSNLKTLIGLEHTPKQSLFPAWQNRRHNLFKYPILKRSLTVSEAKKCLYHLVTSVANALCELHSDQFQLAHLDICLDNICFRDSPAYAVLIDLDRSCHLNTPSPTVQMRYVESVMYVPEEPKQWEAEQLDWKQLGVMILSVLDGSQEYHKIKLDEVSDDRVKEDEFITTLIKKGKYEVDLLEGSVLNHSEYKSSLDSIVQDFVL